MGIGAIIAWAMCGQSVCAGIAYLAVGDWKHAGYWFSAAAITFFVTI